MANKIVHAAQRKAFEAALNTAMKKVDGNNNKGYIGVIDLIQKTLGKGWPDKAYNNLREAFGKDGKWTRFFSNLNETADREYLKGLIMSLGFEGGFSGYRETIKKGEELGIHIPWIILFDPTSACNLHCTGCWAAEYSKMLNLSFDDMDKIVTEGKELGIRLYVMTGGEPMIRKDDILKLAQKHRDCGFMIFSNGTLIDQEFCDQMKISNNIVFSISIEGNEETTDARRGKGTYQRVMKAMDLLKANKLVYGTSICYTSLNYKNVTSDEFLDFLINKGAVFSWYFHYMPVGNDASVDLIPTPEQRQYMYHRIREVRGYEGGKPIFTMDFQNDGEFAGGCVAGGRCYCHINPNGDVEPCVFIHYSNANIHEKSLLECLQQPLFHEYQNRQPFNDNMLRPCPMLENPELLREIVDASGAKSTDMVSPESAEHLCAKCDKYAENWQPVADKLWNDSRSDSGAASDGIDAK